MDTYKCPLCENRVEYISNDDMVDSHGWHWVTLHDERRIVCPECYNENKSPYMEIGSVKQYNRRGVMVDEQST